MTDDTATTAARLPRRSSLKWPLALTFVVLVVYLLTPTVIYYWDGVSFAINIEGSGNAFVPPALFHPNHLLYNVFGWIAYNAVHAAGINARALYLLQGVNMMLASVAVGLMTILVFDLTRSRYASACLALIFAFSATWWRYATDTNSYIPSILFVIAALVATRKGKWEYRAAVLQAMAMLFHQLAILALPMLFYEQRKARNSGMKFLVATALLVAVPYGVAFYQIQKPLTVSGFFDWITYSSPDAQFTFDAGNIVKTVSGTVKLVFGGRLRNLELEGFRTVVPALLALFAFALTMLVWRFYAQGLPRRAEHRPSSDYRAWLLWLLPYLVFLTVWLPHNTFYRLFYLPPLILLAAHMFNAIKHAPGSARLAALTGVVFSANLTFDILPGTYVSSNPPLRFALEMNEVWDDKTVVYYDALIPDDWTLSYFNPATRWVPLPAEAVSLPAEGGGQSVWIETTGFDRLSRSNPELLSRAVVREKRLVTPRHRIVVAQLEFE
jgi:hypothetical protein